MRETFEIEKFYNCNQCGTYCFKSKIFKGKLTNDEDKEYDVNKLKSY